MRPTNIISARSNYRLNPQRPRSTSIERLFIRRQVRLGRRGIDRARGTTRGARTLASASLSPAAAGAHGRSMPLGLTASTTNPSRPHRTQPPQAVGVDDGGRTRRGRLSKRDDQGRALAIVRQRLGFVGLRDQAAAGRLHHATEIVAGDACGQRRIRRRARIRVRRQPLLQQERILRAFHGVHQMQSSVAAAHADVAAVGRDQDVRLRRPRLPQRREQISSAPDQRSGVRNRPNRMMPRLAAISGPMPNAGTRPTAPGSAATHCVTKIIQSMPMPIIAQNRRSKPTGIAARPSRPAGITTAETTGIAARLASTP